MDCSALTCEPFGCFCIARFAEEELERVAVRVDRPREVRPGFFDLDRGLIHAPGVRGGFEVRPASLLQFGGRALDPAVDRRVVNPQPAFPHHFFQVAVAQRIPQVPAHAQHNDLGFVRDAI